MEKEKNHSRWEQKSVIQSVAKSLYRLSYLELLTKMLYAILTSPTAVDSVVGLATDYGLEERGVGVRVVVKVKNFLSSTSSRPALGSTQTPIQWVPGTLSPEVKRPGREADQSPPTSAEFKKIRIYTLTPTYAFMV
jgi:hypothetical protein